MSTTYKDAGVDIEAGDALVDWLVESAPGKDSKSPHQDKIVSGIGGFAALFRAQFDQYKSPCLVSSTDGVGTKVKVASDLNMMSGIGQDLVAMCVNDLICVGADPLFFLDYYATGKLQLDHAKQFLSGVRKACHESNCALIGGETAEMPGIYANKDFDCAGFAVGVVDEGKTLGAHRVQRGDVLVGIGSSGPHSNGFSLLRKVFADDINNWAEKIMAPTLLYVKLATHLRDTLGDDLHAFAHNTGGGLNNLLRVTPKNLGLALAPWDVPPLFREVKKRADISWQELLTTLNCGIGLVAFVHPSKLEQTKKEIELLGFTSHNLGEVTSEHAGQWRLDFSQMDR